MPTEAEIKEALRDCVKVQKRTPGIVVGLVDDSGRRIVSYGKFRQDSQEEVNGDTVFEIGSLTKVFTSLLLAEMVLNKQVQLDDPISKYLPQSVKAPARNAKEITLVDLATHTSGLPRLPSNLSGLDMILHADNPYAKYSVDQMYDFLAGYKLPRDIGSEYEYSNLGAGLLGHLLALKAGTNYEALVMQRICLPLGMTNTRISLSPELKRRLATGHNEAGKPVSNWDIPTLAGAGALRSTVNDMLNFVAANMGLQKSELQPAMDFQHTPRHTAGSSQSHIGLGWHIAKNGPVEMVWHNGGTGGYHSFAGFIKGSRRGIIVLCNSNKANEDLAEDLLGFRKQPTEVKIDLNLYDLYLGEYDFGSKRVFKVTRKGDHLFGQLTGQGAIELFPESETEFFCKAVKARVSFVKNGGGAVTGLVLHQGGADLNAPKLN